MFTLYSKKKVIKMKEQLLSQKITEAQLQGKREISYYDDGQIITLKMPEISPRTTEMMY